MQQLFEQPARARANNKPVKVNVSLWTRVTVFVGALFEDAKNAWHMVADHVRASWHEGMRMARAKKAARAASLDMAGSDPIKLVVAMILGVFGFALVIYFGLALLGDVQNQTANSSNNPNAGNERGIVRLLPMVFTFALILGGFALIGAVIYVGITRD